jgi:NAD(P)H-nitrite reductase large subunit
MSDTQNKTICYCFGYTKSDIEADFRTNGCSTILKRILAAKASSGCRCPDLNPSVG